MLFYLFSCLLPMCVVPDLILYDFFSPLIIVSK